MSKYKEKYKPLEFPRDEQKHNHVIEWWYFNGNLRDEKDQEYSFMNTLFATKPKQVKIPFLSQVPLKTLYFSHYLLSDNQKHKFYHKINPICIVDPNSFTKPLLWILYDNISMIEETKLFNYHLVNDYCDLYLKSTKQPLLLNKTGFIDLKIKTTYYYSLTHLQAIGYLKINQQWIPVKGLAWMDHQWAQGPLMRGDKWIWFSVQLSDGTDLVCFEYGDEVKTRHASLMDKQQKVKVSDKVIIEPVANKFISSQTGSEYMLNYLISLPEFDLYFEVEPYNKKQEMIFGTINYWEGGIKIKAKSKGKEIMGRGFMELVGSPMKKNVFNVYMNRYKKLLQHPLKTISREFSQKLKAYK